MLKKGALCNMTLASRAIYQQSLATKKTPKCASLRGMAGMAIRFELSVIMQGFGSLFGFN